MSIPTSNSQVWLKREVMDLQPVVRTSRPYPILQVEELKINAPSLLAVTFKRYPSDFPEIQVSVPSVIGGVFKAILRGYADSEECVVNLPSFVGGNFRKIRLEISATPEEVQVSTAMLLSGVFKSIRISYDVDDGPNNYIQISPISMLGGSFVRT